MACYTIAENTEEFMQILCSWQAQLASSVTVPVAPYMTEELQQLMGCAQDFALVSPSRFKIMNWEKVAAFLMNLAFSTKKMPLGELWLHIEDYGTLHFYVREKEAGCRRTEDPCDLSLPKAQAAPLPVRSFPAFCHRTGSTGTECMVSFTPFLEYS